MAHLTDMFRTMKILPLSCSTAILSVVFVSALLWAQEPAATETDPPSDLAAEGALIANARQLTFAGKRAGEGYFGAEGTKLVFQSERDEANPFFQIYVLDLETGDTERVSPGVGKTTCAWLNPDGKHVMFASTHGDPESVKLQEAEIAFRKSGKERRYSWDYDEHYEIYSAPLDGSSEPRNLTNTRGYDAEGSYSPDGTLIAFASNRHAYSDPPTGTDKEEFDRQQSYLMDIYTMKADGSDVRRLTDVRGYDGGPFFSADGKKICWRRFSPDGATAEIHTMNVDGSDQQQITRIGAMSWAPFFHPSGQYLIFATNVHGFANFELYMIDAAGKHEPVRVTYKEGFDGLPSFSPDGTKLSWTSNRTSDGKSQIFLGDWSHEKALGLLGLDDRPASEPAIPIPAVLGTKAGITDEDLDVHIRYLASEALQGRLTGTEGEHLATEYVARRFKDYGLEPAGTDGTYFQPFEFTAGIELGGGNVLTITQSAGSAPSTELAKDWQPLALSSVGNVGPLEIVFGGYGLEVPEGTGDDGKKYELYSSYFHLDVKDKWVLMFRYMPEDVGPELRRRYAQHSSLRYKALAARQQGAKGILVVSGPNSQARSQLVPLGFDASLAGSGLAALSITDALAESLLKAGGEARSLKALQDKLDTGEMLAGFPLKDVKIGATVDIKQQKRIGRNVLARLPASEADAQAAPVLFGAHVDHLGPNAGMTSLAVKGEENQIHFGADDNASGTAGMMEIAEWLAAQRGAGQFMPTRDILFAAWSGEELGLLGSAHFARELAKSLNNGNADEPLTGRIAAAFNMDMIGRLEKSVVLQGIGSSSYWQTEIERRNVAVGLPIVTQDDTYLPTDATSFYLRGVPILNAFTGAHEDYHTPRDTADKINLEGARKISTLMGLIVRDLASSAVDPDFKEVKRPEDKGARAGLRAYLGTIPDYSQGGVEGVKLSGVTKGAPADKAGIKGGDILVKLAGKEIKNIYDYTYVLEAMKIGDAVEIEVQRGEERLKLSITPGSRD